MSQINSKNAKVSPTIERKARGTAGRVKAVSTVIVDATKYVWFPINQQTIRLHHITGF